jgi:hypothetical protein
MPLKITGINFCLFLYVYVTSKEIRSFDISVSRESLVRI